VCRYNYVTPTSYLELLTTFMKLLGTKRNEIMEMKRRLEVGKHTCMTYACTLTNAQMHIPPYDPAKVTS
jgi:dynein heavy chain